MKAYGTTHEFTKELVRETSFSSTSIGVSESTMEIFVRDGDEDKRPRAIGYCSIEWVYNIGTPREDAVHVGCWFEKGRLSDYDGVFDLNSDLIKILNKNGFVVPREFRNR